MALIITLFLRYRFQIPFVNWRSSGFLGLLYLLSCDTVVILSLLRRIVDPAFRSGSTSTMFGKLLSILGNCSFVVVPIKNIILKFWYLVYVNLCQLVMHLWIPRCNLNLGSVLIFRSMLKYLQATFVLLTLWNSLGTILFWFLLLLYDAIFFWIHQLSCFSYSHFASKQKKKYKIWQRLYNEEKMKLVTQNSEKNRLWYQCKNENCTFPLKFYWSKPVKNISYPPSMRNI